MTRSDVTACQNSPKLAVAVLKNNPDSGITTMIAR